MFSKSLVFWCLIVKSFCTEASIIPTQSSTNGVKLNNSFNHNDELEERVDILSRKLSALESRIEDLIKVNNLSSTTNTNATTTRTSTVSTTTATLGGKNGDHLVILGGDDVNDNALSDVEVLDMQTEDKGCDPTDLSSTVGWHASVYSSTLQSIITCGGWGNYGSLSSCSVQTKNGHHISIPSMNLSRYYFAMVTIQNKLYSLGGWETENTMETITLNATGTWNQQPMPFSVYGHCAVVLDNNIIVIGGRDENDNYLDTSWIYNVVTKDWSEGPKLNEKRSAHACLVDEETRTIHVIGGYDENYNRLKSTEKWVFGRDSWVSGASLPEPVRSSAAVKSNTEETIGYLVAGYTKNGATSKVWSLRRRDMMWIEDGSKRLQTPREDHTVVNIPGDQIPGC